MSGFQGIWVALVTPFRNGEIDFASLDRLAGSLLDDGVAGLVVCGTTGEAAALSQEEQLAVLDAVLQRVPAQRVIMGLAGNQLSALLDLQREIQRRPWPACWYRRPTTSARPRPGWSTSSPRWPMPPKYRWCCTTSPTARGYA